MYESHILPFWKVCFSIAILKVKSQAATASPGNLEMQIPRLIQTCRIRNSGGRWGPATHAVRKPPASDTHSSVRIAGAHPSNAFEMLLYSLTLLKPWDLTIYVVSKTACLWQMRTGQATLFSHLIGCLSCPISRSLPLPAAQRDRTRVLCEPDGTWMSR